MSRSLLASVLLTFSGVAAAVPVQLDFAYSDMFYGNAVRAGTVPGELQIGDAYTRGFIRDVDYELVVTNVAGGFGSAYTGISQELGTSGSDELFSASFDADLTAIAQLSGPMDASAYSLAEIRFNAFGMQFEVFEPVFYTGSFGVFADRWNPFGDYFAPYFESGSILQPGTYAFTVAPYQLDPSLWISTRTTTPGEVVTGTASANYGFQFASVVPTPATLPLLALVLGCMVFGRRYARARAT